LQEARAAHRTGRLQQALALYQQAQAALRVLRQGQPAPDGLVEEEQVYLAAAMGQVLESAQLDDAALQVYLAADAMTRKLPEMHASRTLLHGCLASVYFHKEEYDAAFRHSVHAHLGCGGQWSATACVHPEAALTSHNLACVLERMGQVRPRAGAEGWGSRVGVEGLEVKVWR